jgi:hypothetical protein
MKQEKNQKPGVYSLSKTKEVENERMKERE